MKRGQKRKKGVDEVPIHRKHLQKKIRVERDPTQVGPTEVAVILGKTYQRARNLMLAGKFGATKYDEDTRKLSVKRDAVLAFKSGAGSE